MVPVTRELERHPTFPNLPHKRRFEDMAVSETYISEKVRRKSLEKKDWQTSSCTVRHRIRRTTETSVSTTGRVKNNWENQLLCRVFCTTLKYSCRIPPCNLPCCNMYTGGTGLRQCGDTTRRTLEGSRTPGNSKKHRTPSPELGVEGTEPVTSPTFNG